MLGRLVAEVLELQVIEDCVRMIMRTRAHHGVEAALALTEIWARVGRHGEGELRVPLLVLDRIAELVPIEVHQEQREVHPHQCPRFLFVRPGAARPWVGRERDRSVEADGVLLHQVDDPRGSPTEAQGQN